jgi:hypothetical protein
MPAQHLMAFIGAPLDVDQGGSRVILRDYSLERTTAVRSWIPPAESDDREVVLPSAGAWKQST